LNPSNAFHRIDLRELSFAKWCAFHLFDSSHTRAPFRFSKPPSRIFSPVRKLPSARSFVSLLSFDRGKTMATTRTTDICLPKPQLRVPASRALPVPRQGLRPGGENMLWGTFSMPENLAFHDARIASVGDGFLNACFGMRFLRCRKTIHRTSDALVASFDSFPVAFATSGPNRRLPRLLHALPSVKKIGHP